MKTAVAIPDRPSRVLPVALLVILVLLLAAAAGLAYLGSATGGNVLTFDLSEPLNGAKTAKVDINIRTDNVTIDRLTGGEQLLARGTLEYVEGQGLPTQSVRTDNGQTTLTLGAGEGEPPPFRFPWAASNEATDWQIHLNPTVASDITLRGGGGNMTLNLAGMAVTRVLADIGGGNMDVILPDNVADLSVAARTGGGNVTIEIGSGTTGRNTINANSGAGNVLVRVPSGIAVRVHATSVLGMVVMDPGVSKIDDKTYQSLDYDSAANKVEITLDSGAGNVSVETK